MRLLSDRPHEPDFWKALLADWSSNLKFILAIQIIFSIYVVTVGIGYSLNWRWALSVVGLTNAPNSVFSLTVPYYASLAERLAEGRFAHRGDITRHVLTILWLQIYVTAACWSIWARQFAKSAIAGLRPERNDRYHVSRIAIAFAPFAIGLWWLAWHMNWLFPNSTGPSSSTYLERSVYGIAFHSFLAAATGNWFGFWLVHFLMHRQLSRTGTVASNNQSDDAHE